MADGPRIRRLPPEVVNRIAAGEVVERPASVVKELVENALDAGATRIDVEVREGGRALIRVTDDGCGMSAEDLDLAFVAHATSKLTDVDDLLTIGTMGFRGEALASIGAVSRARILTRRRDEPGGHEAWSEFGRVSPVRPAAAPPGTTVEAADLFRNIPAREKFLKSPGAEMARITEVIHRFGIGTDGVEIRLSHSGRPVLAYPKEAARRERIARAFGRDLREELIDARGEGPNLAVKALLAPPSRTAADGTRLLFFLNGRCVKDRTLVHAVRSAYEDLIFGARHPIAFVFLAMDPADVDQNVHPAKLEVRFRKPAVVHQVVHRAVREALVAADLAHPAGPRGGAAAGREELVRDALADYLAANRPGDGRPPGGRPPGLFDRPPAAATGPVGGPGPAPAPEAPDRPATADGAALRLTEILPLRNSFLVTTDERGLVIVDQHALHERVLFDRIRARFLAGRTPVQRFLAPVVVDLPAGEAGLLLEQADLLAELGVLVEPFGPDSVAVGGLPAGADRGDPAEIVGELVAGLRDERPADREDLVHRLLATVACKAAVKAGDPLKAEEVRDLLDQAAELEHGHTCPHGRPTTLRIAYEDLERRFRRRG